MTRTYALLTLIAALCSGCDFLPGMTLGFHIEPERFYSLDEPVQLVVGVSGRDARDEDGRPFGMSAVLGTPCNAEERWVRTSPDLGSLCVKELEVVVAAVPLPEGAPTTCGFDDYPPWSNGFLELPEGAESKTEHFEFSDDREVVREWVDTGLDGCLAHAERWVRFK